MSATVWNLLQGGFVIGLLPFVVRFGKLDNLKLWAALLATYLFHQFTIWHYDFARAYAIDAFLLVPFAVACFYLGATRSPYFFMMSLCLAIWAVLCVSAFALSGVVNAVILQEVVNVPIWVFGLLLIFSPPIGTDIDAKFDFKRHRAAFFVERVSNRPSMGNERRHHVERDVGDGEDGRRSTLGDLRGNEPTDSPE